MSEARLKQNSAPRDRRTSWLQKRVHGVSTLLTKCAHMGSKVAWAVGTVTVAIAYPLAMAIVEERVVAQQR